MGIRIYRLFWVMGLAATLYLSGCTTIRTQSRDVKLLPVPEQLESGLTLARPGAADPVSLVRLPRGTIMQLTGRTRPLVLVGVDTAMRTVRFNDAKGVPVDLPFDELGGIALSDGKSVAHWIGSGVGFGPYAAAPLAAYRAMAIPMGLLMNVPLGEILMPIAKEAVVLAAAGAAVGSVGGAIYGAAKGPPPVSYRIGPSEWQVLGGRGARLGQETDPTPEEQPAQTSPGATQR